MIFVSLMSMLCVCMSCGAVSTTYRWMTVWYTIGRYRTRWYPDVCELSHIAMNNYFTKIFLMKIPVLLIEDVKWLWKKWEIAHVAPSYAINVLFAQKKAVSWDKWTLNNHTQAQEKKKNEVYHREQELLILQSTLKDWLTIHADKTPHGKLFAKVDAKRIAKELNVSHLQLSCDKIDVPWTYPVKFKEWAVKFIFDVHVV